MEIPQSSAIVGRDGRVLLASQWARQVEDKVWLLTGRAGSGNRIVRNAAGTVTIHAVDVGYRFAVPYIATGRDGDDMAQPLIAAMTIALGVEAGKSRTSRIALFQTTAVQDQFLRQVCRDAIPDAILAHGGEATEARDAYRKLAPERQRAMHVFLLSLTRPTVPEVVP